jgi:hypothetical protein
VHMIKHPLKNTHVHTAQKSRSAHTLTHTHTHTHVKADAYMKDVCPILECMHVHILAGDGNDGRPQDRG